MIIETVQLRNQKADEGMWLYKDMNDGYRIHKKIVYLGKNEEPWQECTDAEMQQWQDAWDAAHNPQPDSESEE